MSLLGYDFFTTVYGQVTLCGGLQGVVVNNSFTCSHPHLSTSLLRKAQRSMQRLPQGLTVFSLDNEPGVI
ncbi:hypothetical protein Q671_08575 [Halomonas sp. PBN3]|nr:hypothetical protein Q671_08575 [Halomonas sp. PBN3]